MSNSIKIHHQLKSLLENTKSPMGCKDLDSRHIYSNNAFANLIGLQCDEDVIGRKDNDMPCDTAEHAEDFQKQDKIVIQSKKRIRALDVHPFTHGWSAYVFEKSPLYDISDSQKVVGTIFRGFDLSDQRDILAAGRMLAKTQIHTNTLQKNEQQLSCQISNFDSPSHTPLVNISNKQSEVLFFLIRGKNFREIGILLKISTRTVEKHIENLKEAFKALGKSDLIEKALDFGFGNFIPESLFTKQLSVMLDKT